jgi:transcriptional regulator with XRE-family HTH domain
MKRQEFAKRLTLAYRRYLGAEPDPGQAEFGRRVMARIKRPPPHQSAVSKWFKGALPGDLEAMEALADELGVRRGWLYFGEAPMTDAPAAERAAAADEAAGRASRRSR